VANDVAGVLKLAGVHAEVAVAGVKQALEIGEAEGVVDSERADDAEAKPLVDDAVELGNGVAVGRLRGLRLAN